MKEKIIFNTDSLIMGGAEKIAMDYVNLLNEIGKYEILLLINEDNKKEKNVLISMIPKNVKYKYVTSTKIIEQINIYRELKKKHIIYKLFYNYYLKQRRKNFQKNIKKILANENYDYLFDFCFKTPAELLDYRSISWIHSTLNGIRRKTWNKKMKQINRGGKFIVITEDLKKEFNECFPKGKEKVKCLYNFFDLDVIRKKSQATDKLDTNEKKLLQNKYILACSRIDDNKDLKTLIYAYKVLKEKYQIKEKLYIIGDGPSKEKNEKLVKKNNLEKDILFLGTKVNPYIWMKNAEIFVHSSLREGFGMVIVEAMICETLVIVTDCPVGPREILENGKDGILVKIGDYNTMAEQINKYLTIPEKKNDIIKKANKRVLDFSKEKMKKEVNEILLEIKNKKGNEK